MKSSESIVKIAVGVWRRTPPVAPSPSDVGSIPQQERSGCDSCASFPDPDDVKAGRAVVSMAPIGHNSCEGGDCIEYDLGVPVMLQKGKI